MIKFGKGICYSGYRVNQSPIINSYPSEEEVLEDLRILEQGYDYIRLYDLTELTLTVLNVIRTHNINIKVLMGVYLMAEVSHINHPNFGIIPDEILDKNKQLNDLAIHEALELIKTFSESVIGVSVGNESRSIWNVNRVTRVRLVELIHRLKSEGAVPVTYCEETHYWIDELEAVAKAVDFISFHTYPVWNDASIDEAMIYINKAYEEVKATYPNKALMITETGWPTKTHGSKIPFEWATVANQSRFIDEIEMWAEKQEVVVFLFEAFDEPWKGENHPDEPEKHWGLYNVNRVKKN